MSSKKVACRSSGAVEQHEHKGRVAGGVEVRHAGSVSETSAEQGVETGRGASSADAAVRSAAGADDALTPQLVGDVVRLYLGFRGVTDVDPHVCSPSCEWLRRGWVYLCIKSGRVHACGEQTCTARYTQEATIVCGLTSNVLGVQFGLPQSNTGVRKPRRVTTTPVAN